MPRQNIEKFKATSCNNNFRRERTALAFLFLANIEKIGKDLQGLSNFVNGDAQLLTAMLNGLPHQRLTLRAWHVADKFADRNTQGTCYLFQAGQRGIAINGLRDSLLADTQTFGYLLGSEATLLDFVLNIWHTIYIFNKQRHKDRYFYRNHQTF